MLICATALAYSWSEIASAVSEGTSATSALQSSTHKLRFQPIVNGHNLQPRDDQLKSLHINDTSAQESQTIDWLYQRLLARNSRRPFFPSSERRPPITDTMRQDAAGIAQAEEVELDGKLNICRGC